MEQAQAHLPLGFSARDAHAVLGTPGPTGKGTVMVSNLARDESALGPAGCAQGEVLIAVHAPETGVDLAARTSDSTRPPSSRGPAPRPPRHGELDSSTAR